MMCNLHGVPVSHSEPRSTEALCTPLATQQGEVGHLAVISYACQFGCPKAAILCVCAISCAARPRWYHSNISEP